METVVDNKVDTKQELTCHIVRAAMQQIIYVSRCFPHYLISIQALVIHLWQPSCCCIWADDFGLENPPRASAM